MQLQRKSGCPLSRRSVVWSLYLKVSLGKAPCMITSYPLLTWIVSFSGSKGSKITEILILIPKMQTHSISISLTTVNRCKWTLYIGGAAIFTEKCSFRCVEWQLCTGKQKNIRVFFFAFTISGFSLVKVCLVRSQFGLGLITFWCICIRSDCPRVPFGSGLLLLKLFMHIRWCGYARLGWPEFPFWSLAQSQQIFDGSPWSLQQIFKIPSWDIQIALVILWFL